MTRAPRRPTLYIGLFACLWLATLCLAFLDIRYGTFAKVALFWALIHAAALSYGWHRRNAPLETIAGVRKAATLVAVLTLLIVILPIWGLTRGMVYFLGLLLAISALDIRNRRRVYQILLGSMVIMLFAVADYRADFTMGFYLVPYLFALLFTLIAEQLDHPAESDQTPDDGLGMIGRWRILLTTSGIILSLALLLYVLTPQWQLIGLNWDYGLPIPQLRDGEEIETRNTPASGSSGGGGGNGAGQAPYGTEGGQPITPDSTGSQLIARMREAAARPGMPQWQSFVLTQSADLGEVMQKLRQTLGDALKSLTDALKDALESILEALRQAITVLNMVILSLILLLLALLVLLREVRPFAWLHTRLDYLLHRLERGSNEQTAIALYRRTERLCDYYLSHRATQHNTQEYLDQLTTLRRDLTPQLARITQAFDTARYHRQTPSTAELQRARSAYIKLYRNLTE